MPKTTAPLTTTQQLGSLIKSARDVMRKDKGLSTDLDRLPNWGRGHQTGGEDPYLSGELVAQQIHGIQAKGFMSEMKHFLMYNGQSIASPMNRNSIYHSAQVKMEKRFKSGGSVLGAYTWAKLISTRIR